MFSFKNKTMVNKNNKKCTDYLIVNREKKIYQVESLFKSSAHLGVLRKN